jgi:apolipoprotein D and lipocalin family protein
MKAFTVVILALLLITAIFLLIGRTGIPEGITVVKGFDLNRYLGTWYEIARLDHSFERGLTHVTIEYIAQEDGSVKVINRGFNIKHRKWEESIGKAYPIEAPDTGRLKISFFGPFYGSFNIIELDKESYSYSMATGPSRSFLWILSRHKNLDPIVMQNLVQKAKGLGFKLEKLIYVDHKDFPTDPVPTTSESRH